MIQYKHLCSFDLTSYGTALQMINQFVDDEGVKVFEVSPCGSAAVLILLAKDIHSLQILKCQAEKFFAGSISALAAIESIHEELLPVYLSQNKPKLQNCMQVVEGGFVSPMLKLADQSLKNGVSAVDFRVIRTFPINVILTLTAESAQSLNPAPTGFKASVIENIQPSLSSFYEIR